MFTVDINRVLSRNDLPTYIMKAAIALNKYSYLSCGDYFKELDDVEVEELVNCYENINSPNYRQFTITDKQAEEDLRHISLLTFLLAMGEGETDLNADNLSSFMQSLACFIAVESLYRKNKGITLHRENYSILDPTRIIASQGTPKQKE